ncbi:hypothetical protein QTP70_022208, partial [Hemibagrus guttatus]
MACDFVYVMGNPIQSANTPLPRIPPPVGTFWFCGASLYSELPTKFIGRCTVVYALPAIREKPTLIPIPVLSNPTNHNPQVLTMGIVLTFQENARIGIWEGD